MELKKILVIDDEQIARDRICRFLAESSHHFEVKQASNGVEALELISTNKPSVIFLDIQMPGLSGFEVLQQLESRDFQIIFQTAFDEYAIQAFEESACDYLLKPFSKDRFDKALERAITAHDQQQVLKNLSASLKNKNQFLEKVTYRQGGRLKVLSVREITHFISRDHCTCAYTKTSEHILDLSLSYLEENLDPQQFIRCHRSNIVAIAELKSIGGTNDSLVELRGGTTLPLSRSNRSSVLESIGAN